MNSAQGLATDGLTDWWMQPAWYHNFWSHLSSFHCALMCSGLLPRERKDTSSEYNLSSLALHKMYAESSQLSIWRHDVSWRSDKTDACWLILPYILDMNNYARLCHGKQKLFSHRMQPGGGASHCYLSLQFAHQRAAQLHGRLWEG